MVGVTVMVKAVVVAVAGEEGVSACSVGTHPLSDKIFE